MIFISEAESTALVTHELAYAAARRALLAAVDEDAHSFPAVLGHGSARANRFTVKSAATAEVAGLKVGSYWPGNAERGLPRHNSLVLLFDQEVGRIGAVIEAGQANAYRTAAADAVAADALARPDARALAVFGTGHQAFHECAALARVREFEVVRVVARDADRGAAFARKLAGHGLTAVPASAEEACRSSDVVVTATTSRAPLFDAAWIGPGTHVASMGSDARGKQELPPELLATARLFCDWPAQSREIGEFQHAPAHAEPTALGHVLSGRSPGRRSADEITVFDSSGIGLQDLFLAVALLEAREHRAQPGS
ncbi:ornithine cyclodeaminase family protein [Saccharothrix coeruleofusca]|uniref:Ornithine cyclodeaminase n=1 Tax=Saccharothrix coeruleofusca TaxID=33919 RepID=A0A918ATQ9_9PSEU|nr:ornithine cyclodeaminase family protein [Saccharothrix coeruleofusca]GGP82779.1 ornithine cyclodeaminase [Saccharothrix coeruleofusca]